MAVISDRCPEDHWGQTGLKVEFYSSRALLLFLSIASDSETIRLLSWLIFSRAVRFLVFCVFVLFRFGFLFEEKEQSLYFCLVDSQRQI